jgi:hypothetical protein
MPKHTGLHLTARNDIGPYRKGDHIEEAADVDRLLAGEHRHHFVRVVPEPPLAEPKSEAPKTEGPKLAEPAAGFGKSDNGTK